MHTYVYVRVSVERDDKSKEVVGVQEEQKGARQGKSTSREEDEN